MKKREDKFPKRKQRFWRLKEKKISKAEILRELDITLANTSSLYNSKQPSAKPGTVNDKFATQIYIRSMKSDNANLVDPTMFYGAYQREREALAMTADLLHHPTPEKAGGFFLSGGTESINQAVWMLRNKYFLEKYDFNIRTKGFLGLYKEFIEKGRKIPTPKIIAPIDSHFAIYKAADIFGLGMESIVFYDLDQDYNTDFRSLEQKVREVYETGEDIFVSFTVVGDTQKGKIQDVRRINEIIKTLSEEYKKKNPPIVVDAAAQYLFASLMRESKKYNKKIPDWDFTIRNVRAIIADPHKNQIPYNTGILLIRDPEDLKYTHMEMAHYLATDLSKNFKVDENEMKLMQAVATIPTSRGGYGAAATWAYYLNNGREGLRKKKEKIWELVQRFTDYIKHSEYYELISEPETAIVAFCVKNGSDKDNKTIYNRINHGPNDYCYISESDSLRARNIKEVKEKNGFSGLYIQIMEHNDKENLDYLMKRLDEEAYKLKKLKK